MVARVLLTANPPVHTSTHEPAANRGREQQMIEPPTEHQLVRENSRVEIINASGTQSFGQVAADRLAWEGFVPQISTEVPAYQAQTTIYDFTGQSKGSSLATLVSALRINSSNVVVTPDPNRTVDFLVVLGGSYSSCTYNVALPK